MADFYRLVEQSPALQARARLMADQGTGLLAETIAAELGVPADDVVAVTAASVLSAIRTSLLEVARRESLAGAGARKLSTRLTDATDRAFGLLDGDLVRLGS
jgi:hypothetical protein